MKREASQDNKDEGQLETEEHVSKKGRRSEKPTNSELNLEDLGAGYNVEDKRVAKAILYYESKLLPFISDNYPIFKNSNFLNLKGYATGCKPT